MTTKINRILFDYDGTLIIHDKQNQSKQIAQILNLPDIKTAEFIRRLNYFFETSFGRQYYANRKMSYDLYFHILNIIMEPHLFGITAQQLDVAINEKSKGWAKIEPTAKETLDYLTNKGYQLCVFTNGFWQSQVNNMKYHGLYEYFDRIYAWDDFYAKPDKRALIRALAGTEPKCNVMVGDSLTNDIVPAKARGVYTVGINI